MNEFIIYISLFIIIIFLFKIISLLSSIDISLEINRDALSHMHENVYYIASNTRDKIKEEVKTEELAAQLRKEMVQAMKNR